MLASLFVPWHLRSSQGLSAVHRHFLGLSGMPFRLYRGVHVWSNMVSNMKYNRMLSWQWIRKSASLLVSFAMIFKTISVACLSACLEFSSAAKHAVKHAPTECNRKTNNWDTCEPAIVILGCSWARYREIYPWRHTCSQTCRHEVPPEGFSRTKSEADLFLAFGRPYRKHFWLQVWSNPPKPNMLSNKTVLDKNTLPLQINFTRTRSWTTPTTNAMGTANSGSSALLAL